MRLSGINFLWISVAYVGASYTLLALLSALIGQVGFYEDVTLAFASVAVALLLAGVYKLFHSSGKLGFTFKRWGKGIYIGLAGLAAAVWYVFVSLVRKDPLCEFDEIIRAVIVAFGTAFLEETLFRGIVLSSTYYCRRYSDGKIAFALIWSSIVCAAVQLKDFAGSDVVTLLVNMIYAFVMGMFFGALFLRCRNLFSVMVIHWIINFFSLIFVYGSKETPGWTIYIYALILLFILVASIYLLRSSKINSVYGLWGSYSNKSRYKRYK